jgi:UDP-N-acetylmuramate--alanine ligase
VNPRPIHLTGIGGAGMSGLARLAAQAGYAVTGTDRDESEVLAALRSLGIVASAGHAASALPPDAQALVVSTAIAPDNPELLAAQERGIPILHRAELLCELMSRYRGLTVAGAHGKSTTSAMLAMALGGASACIGATIPEGDGTGAVWADGPWFVAEADESDRSLLHLAPEAAILLNVDHDHHSTYASLAEVQEVFRDFVRRLPPDGVLVVGPDEVARDVADVALCPVRLVGQPGGFRPQRDGRGGVLIAPDGDRVDLRLEVPGWHNYTNAACAIALADWCGVPPAVAAERLTAFTGVGRRFELRGVAGGVTVVDDYAHHPAEIAATLAAARERHGGRIVVVFQPHLYSRTKALAAELSAALGGADVAVVTEIYAAREQRDPSISGRDLLDAIPTSTDAVFAATLDDALQAAARAVRPGDLVLTMGAGDITRLGQELLTRLQRPHVDGGDTDGSAAARTSR